MPARCPWVVLRSLILVTARRISRKTRARCRMCGKTLRQREALVARDKMVDRAATAAVPHPTSRACPLGDQKRPRRNGGFPPLGFIEQSLVKTTTLTIINRPLSITKCSHPSPTRRLH
uniref:Putative secreted peptide n=1 Tax=Anopheles braziliensis TaxID=58242 RepID=A0A2M3ZQJ4_9DIPT